MALFVVSGAGSLNLSNQVFQGFDGISFQTSGDLNVVLKDTQFALMGLQTDSTFQGSGFTDSIQIGISKDATFVGSSYSLAGWSVDDSFSFYDNKAGNEDITGTQGSDRFYISGGTDHVDGNLGSDDILILNWAALTTAISTTGNTLTDFSGSAVSYLNIDRFNLTLGQGNDTVVTGAGYDVVRAGDGNDSINTGAGNAQVLGGAGTDLWVADFTDDVGAKVIDVTLTGKQNAGGGTSYQDIERLGISGGLGADVFTTHNGTPNDGLDDTLSGGGGNDTMTVGGGSDHIDGGAGEDLLIINLSGAPATTNFQMASPGQLTDFSVTNVFFTRVEHFNVTLGAGNDNVAFGAFADTVVGGQGNDTLNTGAGSAVVDGGRGSDLWIADFSGDAIAKDINLNRGGLQDAGGGTTYSGIERMFIKGGGGADVLTSRVGDVTDGLNDTLLGGVGDDTLTVGGGSDSVDGGRGKDLLIINFSGADAGRSFQMANPKLITDFSIVSVAFTGIERFDVRLGGGNDSIVLGSGADRVLGGAGNDSLNTGAGAARVDGGEGRDTWIANFSHDATVKTIDLNLGGTREAGNLTTYAGIEAMSVKGGTGADVFTTRFGNLADAFGDTLFGGGGNDTLTVGGGSDSVDGGGDKDLLIIDYSTAIGSNFNSTPDGSRISDFSLTTVNFTGIERLDVRLGNGHDNIILGTGNDNFSGGDGNDTVVGGIGGDILTSGAGFDRFVFNSIAESTVAAAGRDVITDFDSAADQIDLRMIDAIDGGSDDSFDFVGGSAFTALGQIRVIASGPNTLVQINTTGDLGADMQTTLLGSHVLTVDNFLP